MNHINSNDLSVVIKSCSNATELLEALKSMSLFKDSDANVVDLISSIKSYFEETNASVLQILRSHTGTFEFEVCHPHKEGEEVDVLLDLNCEFYMLPRFKISYQS